MTAPVLKTRRAVVHVLRRAGFRVLASAISLPILNHRMLIGFLLPVLIAQGLGHVLAITAATSLGAALQGAGGAALRNGAAFGMAVLAALSVRRG